MNKRIVFATNNKGKLQEVRQMTEGRIEVLGLNDIGCAKELPEDSDTLEGNALQKAEYVAKNYGVACFADDTGLEVEVLDGRPGVYSARYAGPGCSPSDNIRKLLGELQGATNRKARFRTVLAWVDGGDRRFFEGRLEGRILETERGKKGFGYDPVFQPDGFGQSLAEMTANEKNAISHRRHALDNFLSELLIA